MSKGDAPATKEEDTSKEVDRSNDRSADGQADRNTDSLLTERNTNDFARSRSGDSAMDSQRMQEQGTLGNLSLISNDSKNPFQRNQDKLAYLPKLDLLPGFKKDGVHRVGDVSEDAKGEGGAQKAENKNDGKGENKQKPEQKAEQQTGEKKSENRAEQATEEKTGDRKSSDTRGLVQQKPEEKLEQQNSAKPADGTKIDLSPEQKEAIGKKVWMNEAGGSVDKLTHWNKGEDFPSLGIGHMIWQPEGKTSIYGDSFKSFVKKMEDQKNPDLPKWLNSEMGSPWKSKGEFEANFNSPKMKELREFLTKTIPQQTDHLISRLEESKTKILDASSPQNKDRVGKNFDKVLKSGPEGAFAMVDYVNFKGEGLTMQPSYNNNNWGLRQVLENMKDTGNPVKDFSESAKRTLQNRVDNAPAGKQAQEREWMKGWSKRVDDYQKPLDVQKKPADASKPVERVPEKQTAPEKQQGAPEKPATPSDQIKPGDNKLPHTPGADAYDKHQGPRQPQTEVKPDAGQKPAQKPAADQAPQSKPEAEQKPAQKPAADQAPQSKPEAEQKPAQKPAADQAPQSKPEEQKPKESGNFEMPKSVEDKAHPKRGQGYYEPMKASMKELLGRNLTENETKAMISAAKGMRKEQGKSVNELKQSDMLLPKNAEEAKTFIDNIGNKKFGRQGLNADGIDKLRGEISNKFKMNEPTKDKPEGAKDPAQEQQKPEQKDPNKDKPEGVKDPAQEQQRPEQKDPNKDKPQVKDPAQEQQKPEQKDPNKDKPQVKDPTQEQQRPEQKDPNKDKPQVKDPAQEQQRPEQKDPNKDKPQVKDPAQEQQRPEQKDPNKEPQVKDPAQEQQRPEQKDPKRDVTPPAGDATPVKDPKQAEVKDPSKLPPGQELPKDQTQPEKDAPKPVEDHQHDHGASCPDCGKGAAGKLQPGDISDNLKILKIADSSDKHHVVTGAKVLATTTLKEPAGTPKDMPVAVVPGMKPGSMGVLTRIGEDGVERKVPFIAGQLRNGRGTRDDIGINEAAAKELGINPTAPGARFRIDAVGLKDKPQAKDAEGIRAEVATRVKDIASQKDVLEKANESNEGKSLNDKAYIPKPDDNGYRRTERSEAELSKIRESMEKESDKYRDLADKLKPGSRDAAGVIQETLKEAETEKASLERQKQQMARLESYLRKGTPANEIPESLMKDLPADLQRDMHLARYNRNAFKQNNDAISDFAYNPFGLHTAKLQENAQKAQAFYKAQEARALEKAHSYGSLSDDKKTLQDRIINDAKHPRAQELLRHRFEMKATAAALMATNPDLVGSKNGKGALDGKRIALNAGHDPYHGSKSPGFGAYEWSKTAENPKGMSEYDFNRQNNNILAEMVSYAGGVPIHVNQEELYKTNPSTQGMIGLAAALKDTKADVIISNHMDDAQGITPGTLTLVSHKSSKLGALINNGKGDVGVVSTKALRVQARGVQAAVNQENMILNEVLTTAPADRARNINPYEIGKLQLGTLIGMERFVNPRTNAQLNREKQRDAKGTSWDSFWNKPDNKSRHQFNSLAYPDIHR